MKRYVLRRDNVETGPYSLTEIQEIGLLPLDLVKEENNDCLWLYPSQIEDLRDLVKTTDPLQETNLAFFDASQKEVEGIKVVNDKLEIPGLISKSVHKKDDPIRERRARRLSAGFIVVAMCFFVTSFLIKKALDVLIERPSTAKLIQIQQEASEPTTNQLVQNALAVEVVNSGQKQKAAYPVFMKLKDIRKLVKVKTATANVSEAGLPATQLYISNESPKLVDRATIQLIYEKPGGEILKKETFSVPMLRPFYTRVMEVPVDEQGVKVKAAVLNIYSEHNGPELKRI